MGLRLTVTILFIGVASALIFSGIQFALTRSLLARNDSQTFERSTRLAASLVRAISNGTKEANSLTYLRALSNGQAADDIAIFNDKGKLIEHTNDQMQAELGKSASDWKYKSEKIESLNKKLKELQTHLAGTEVKVIRDNQNFVGIIAQKHFTFLLMSDSRRQAPWVVLFSYFLLSLMLAGIVSLMVYHYAHEIGLILNKVSRSIEVDSIREEHFEDKYAEITHLIASVAEKLRESQASVPSGIAFKSDTDDVLQKLQNKLFEKAFPRMKSHELAVYPRKPSLEMGEFISGSAENGKIDILIGSTENDGLDAILTKHRTQEKFYALAKQNLDASELSRELWQGLIQKTELAPGLFFIRFDESSRHLDIYRSGAIHLFEMKQDGDCDELKIGSPNFESEFSMVHGHDLSASSHFIMISHSTISALEISAEDFASQLLSTLTNRDTARNILLGLLDKIHQSLPAGEIVPGLIAVFSEK